MIYKSDMDDGWDVRAAAEMEATRNSRVEKRPRGFYTADKCKEQLARIMAEPCPSEVPTGIEYSRMAVVDEWIKHYSELERQDAAVYGQFMNAKIRSYEERLLAAWGNREKFTTPQLEKMLEAIKKEEKDMYIWSATQTCQDLHEVEYDEEEAAKQECVGAIYYRHVADLFYKQNQKALSSSSANRKSSLGPSDKNLCDLYSGRHALESSQLKSPVTDPFYDVSGVVHLRNLENDQDEKMDVDDHDLSFEVDPFVDSPSRDLSQSDHHSKRPRGRPPKKESLTPTRESSPPTTNLSEEAKSPTRSETLRSGGRNESTVTPMTEKDGIQVVDSPAGRVRGARRPAAVDSPLLSKASNAGRTASGVDLMDAKEGSKERETVRRRHCADVGAHLTLSSPSNLLLDESCGTSTQTAVSIQDRSCTGIDGGFVSSRKSSRHDRRSSNLTSTLSTGLNRSDFAAQTDQVKIDSDEKLSVQSPLSEMLETPTASIPSSTITNDNDVVMKTVHCENDQGSRVVVWDDMLNSNISRKSYCISFPEDRTELFEVSFSEFSEQTRQVAKNFALCKNIGERSSLSLCACSPSKRMRKEEKSSGSTFTPKGRMMSTWNLLHEHRHSAIFLHPVTDRDAPDYSCIVHCPFDLTTMKKEVDSGTILNPNMLLRKICMMFTNAVMFNSTGHDVNSYAKEMCKDTIAECCFTMDPRMDTYRVHHRRSRTEEAKRRSTPTSGTSSRTPIRKRK